MSDIWTGISDFSSDYSSHAHAAYSTSTAARGSIYVTQIITSIITTAASIASTSPGTSAVAQDSPSTLADNSPSPQNPTNRTALIVGITTGIIAVLAIVLGGTILYRRRRRKQRDMQAQGPSVSPTLEKPKADGGHDEGNYAGDRLIPEAHGDSRAGELDDTQRYELSDGKWASRGPQELDLRD